MTIGPEAKPPIWKLGIVFILYVAIGAFTVATIEDAIRKSDSYAILFVAVFAWFASTFVHELGHALAGLAVGWRPIVFAVNPIAVRLIDVDILPTWRIHKKVRLSGGWLASMPRHEAAVRRLNRTIMVLGGPAAQLMAGLFCYVLAFYADATARPIWVSHGLAIFAVFSVCLGLQALLPTRATNHVSDGEQLCIMWRADYNPKKSIPIAVYNSLINSRVRLREWPDWIDDMMDVIFAKNAKIIENLHANKIGKYFDSFDIDTDVARKMLDVYLEKFGVSEWYASVSAYCAAVYENAPAKAAFELAALPAQDTPMAMFFAATAAVAARQGDAACANEALANMRAIVCAESPYCNATFQDIDRQITALIT